MRALPLTDKGFAALISQRAPQMTQRRSDAEKYKHNLVWGKCAYLPLLLTLHWWGSREVEGPFYEPVCPPPPLICPVFEEHDHDQS